MRDTRKHPNKMCGLEKNLRLPNRIMGTVLFHVIEEVLNSLIKEISPTKRWQNTKNNGPIK
jgi:hypothetical protein